jgi:outer membrane protein
MKRLVVCSLLAASVAGAQPTQTPPPAPSAPPDGNAGTNLELTMPRAVELAMKQNPTLRQARASAAASAARVELSRVPLRPTLNAAGTLGTGSRRPVACAGDPTQTCGGFFSPDYSTGLSANLNWRIYDFGQTAAQTRAAEANAAASQAGIATNVLDVRVNVETAYLTAVARAKLVTVAETTVKSEETHLDQARRFVAAQAHDPIEVAQAQARAANAHSALAQAQSDAAVALADLRAAIGWVDATRALQIDVTWPEPIAQEPPVLTALVETARAHRPEIVQADKEIAAAQASLDAAHAEKRPTLSANAQTSWNPGREDWSPQPTWSAGLTLSLPILDGGRSSADIKIARANLESASAQHDALLVNLTASLESARAQIIANRANVAASNEAVTAAQAQLKLADARYAQGLGSQIELADAQTAVTTAQGNLVSAELQLADAWAQLRRQVGQP